MAANRKNNLSSGKSKKRKNRPGGSAGFRVRDGKDKETSSVIDRAINRVRDKRIQERRVEMAPQPSVNLYHGTTSKDKKWDKMGCLHCYLFPFTANYDSYEDDYKGQAGGFSGDYVVTTYKVESRGSENPRILFVGEAPGFNEDRQGECFVGIAGNLLFEVLEEAGIPIDDCRFTNTVRCRPENNKTPSFTQSIPCTAFLTEEILTYKPDIIVPLGNTALKVLLNDSKAAISSHIGTEARIDTGQGLYSVFPLWHPAFVSRDEGYRQDYVYYMKRLREIVYGETSLSVNFGIRISKDKKSLSKVRKLIPGIKNKSKFLVYDIETAALDDESSALDPYDDNTRIVSIAFEYRPNHAITLFTYHPDIDREVLRENRRLATELLLTDIPKIAHNAKFDNLFLKLKWGVVPTNFVEDTMLSHYALVTERGKTHGLKLLAIRYGDMGDYSRKIREEDVFGNVFETDIDEFGEYNALDTIATGRVSRYFRNKYKNSPCKPVARSLLPKATEALTDLQSNGIRIDTEIARTVRDVFRRNLTIVDDKIEADPKVSKFIRNMDLLRRKGIIGKSVKEFKIGSGQQLGVILHHSNLYGLPVLETTESGLPSTSSTTLTKLKMEYDCDLIANILSYRTYKKTLSTYLEPFVERAEKHNGFIYGKFHLFVAVTGRLSSSDPNLQNIPNKSAGHVKRIFISRYAPDGFLVGIDYSQLELRVLASLSQDETLMRVYKEGRDLHLQTCLLIYDISEKNYKKLPDTEQKLMRTVAKRVNFGIAYGITAGGIVRILENEGIKLEEEEAQTYIERFLASYPGVDAFIKDTHKKMHRVGYVKSAFNRKRRFPLFKRRRFQFIQNSGSKISTTEAKEFERFNNKIINRAKRQSVNHIIQSTASDMNLCSMIILNKWMAANLDNMAVPFNIIHDAIDFDTHRSVAVELINKAVDVMTNIPEYAHEIFRKGEMDWDFFYRVPIEVSVEVGWNWRDMVECEKSDEFTEDMLDGMLRESREKERENDKKLVTDFEV